MKKKRILFGACGLCIFISSGIGGFGCGASEHHESVKSERFALNGQPDFPPPSIQHKSIPEETENDSLILNWFTGAKVRMIWTEGLFRHYCLSNKLMKILRSKLFYKGDAKLEVRELFRASFGDYTENFKNIGTQILGERFTQNPRILFKPISYLTRLIQPTTHPGELPLPTLPGNLLNPPYFLATEPCSNYETIEKEPENLLELAKRYREWMQTVKVVWPKRWESSHSWNKLSAFPHTTNLGHLVEEAVLGIDRLHYNVRMTALRNLSQALLNMPLVTSDDTIFPITITQDTDGTINLIKYGEKTYNQIEITAGNTGYCIRIGKKEDLKAVSDSMQGNENLDILPGLCRATYVGPTQPLRINEGGTSNSLLLTSLPTFYAGTDTDNGEKMTLGNSAPREFVSHFFTFPDPPPTWSQNDNGCQDLKKTTDCAFIAIPKIILPVFTVDIFNVGFKWAAVMRNGKNNRKLILQDKIKENVVNFGKLFQGCPLNISDTIDKSLLSLEYIDGTRNPSDSSKVFQDRSSIGFVFSSKGVDGTESWEESRCFTITETGVEFQ